VKGNILMLLTASFILLDLGFTLISCKACDKKESEPTSPDTLSTKTAVLPVSNPTVPDNITPTPVLPSPLSKASSDFLARAYCHICGLNVTASNCSNNYGPKQHAEKLIPVIIHKALTHQPIPIYGDGKNIRDWLYVAYHCKRHRFGFS
jgi:hypothetical protein